MLETVITWQKEIVIHLVLVFKRKVSTLESPEFVSFSVMFPRRAAFEWESRNTFQTSLRTLEKFFFTTGSTVPFED